MITARSTHRAAHALNLQPMAKASAYDHIGRNALSFGPVRTYPAKPTTMQRITRAVLGWF